MTDPTQPTRSLDLSRHVLAQIGEGAQSHALEIANLRALVELRTGEAEAARQALIDYKAQVEPLVAALKVDLADLTAQPGDEPGAA